MNYDVHLELICGEVTGGCGPSQLVARPLEGQALCHFLGSLMFRSCAYPPLSSLCSREYPINLQTRVWPLWVCVSSELVWGLSFWLENHLRRSPFSQTPAGPSPAGAPRVLAKESPAASSSNQVGSFDGRHFAGQPTSIRRLKLWRLKMVSPKMLGGPTPLSWSS